ncbi:MAG: sel1 repeat family protein [Deltaproteobacteria bacterium]|jgi:TPR repeat protein|nr:sel1 repeat family protein [Deltaproteobacteria bacterium]
MKNNSLKNPKKARPTKSLDENDSNHVSESLFRTGQLYLRGYGIDKDIAKGLIFFGLAADKGHAEAQLILGIAYFYGHGLEKNIDQAIKYLGLAAEQGHPDAKFMLGLANYEVEKDKKAKELAASQDQAEAQVNLGQANFDGQDGEND